MSYYAPKIIICGPGRAGSSFLTQLLFQLGFDTGFDRLYPNDNWSKVAQAGLEIDEARILNENPHNLAQIIKNPKISTKIDYLVQRGWNIGHVILPIRDMDECCKSRVEMARKKNELLWNGVDEKKFENLETFLCYIVGKIVLDTIRHGIPVTILEYPNFAKDFDYFYRRLSWLLKDLDVEKVRKAHQELTFFQNKS